ncbi:phage tail length tape measure family protein [Methylorubrum podarium]|uniref:Phage tail length tape measure family protein n=1 Tax=Methylorubrum podarium TaxID=200476 RepID=A0ABV1QMR7_9HYPH
MANQVITQLIVDARGAEEGSAQYVRAMKAAQAAADKTLETEDKLQGAIERTGATLTRGAGSVTNIARRWDQLQASVDPVAAAHQKANKAIEDAVLRADAAVRRLGVSQEQAAAVVDKVRMKHLAEVEAVEAATAAANDNSAALARMRAQYDPLFAIQLRHTEALRGIAEAEQAGAISASAAMNARIAATRALQDQTQKLEGLAAAQEAAAQKQVNQQLVVPNRGEDVAAYGAELDRLRARFNPLFAAGQAYKAQLAEIAQAAKVGAISEAERVAALARTKEAFAGQVAAIRATTAANENSTKATALHGQAWQNLGFQVNDAATMLLSGSSAFQVVATQGGQVYQILSGAQGGVGGALKEIGNFLVGLVTPARLLVGGLVGIGVAGVAAGLSWQGTQADIRRALAGVGRAAGATVGERLKTLPQDTWDAMLRRARIYAQAGWSRQEVETWSRAFHAAGGEIIIPVLDAQIEAADGEAKEALACLVEAHRVKGAD